MNKRLCLLWLGGCLVSWTWLGCPTTTTVRNNQNNATTDNSSTTEPSAERPKPRADFVPIRKQLDSLPAGIQTMKFKKDQEDAMLYLHPEGVLSEKPLVGEDGKWQSYLIPTKRHRSWYIQVEPEGGAKLGVYTSISLIMAVFNSPGGYAATSRFAAIFLIRRGDKEIELFRTMVLARGQRYQYYGVDNREIATETPLQKGDVLVFRVAHRTGSTGALGVGGVKDGGYGPRFMISTRQIGNFYKTTK